MRAERSYIVELVFSNFLGLDYSIEYVDSPEWLLVFEQYSIAVPDVFLRNVTEHWLESGAHIGIGSIEEIDNPDWSERKSVCQLFPVISETTKSRPCSVLFSGHRYDWSFDVLGAIFFLITRYEEITSDVRDAHGRFPISESVLYDKKLHLRPLVNEYLTLLKELIRRCNADATFRLHKYRQFISCDIDYLTSPPVNTLFERLAYYPVHFVKNRNFGFLLDGIFGAIKSRIFGYDHDPFNTFDYLVEKAQKTESNIIFYVMAGKNRERLDGNYTIRELACSGVLKSVLKYKFAKVGLHPGYQTYNDYERMNVEKENLADLLESLNGKIILDDVRQHYLRWESGVTPGIQEQAGFTTDSTLGYAESIGFRSSCCYEYPIYHLPERRVTNLVERPLMVMDVTLLEEKYMGISTVEEALTSVWALKSQCIQFGGCFTVLWHNSNLQTSVQKEIFEGIVAESTSESIGNL